MRDHDVQGRLEFVDMRHQRVEARRIQRQRARREVAQMLGDARRRDQVRDERGRILAADRVVPPRHGVDVGEQVVFAIVVAALHRELADALDGVGQDRVIVDADQKGLARGARRARRKQAVALELAVDALVRERRDQLRLGDDRNLLDVVIGLEVRGLEAGLLVLGAIDRDLPVGHLDQFLDPRKLLGADFLDRQIRMRHARVEIAVGDVDQVGILLATLLEFGAGVLGFPELKPVRRGRRRVGGNVAVVELRGFSRDLRYAIHCSSPSGFVTCSGRLTVAIPHGVVEGDVRSMARRAV